MGAEQDGASTLEESGARPAVVQGDWYLLTKRVADRLASIMAGPRAGCARSVEDSGFIIDDNALPYYVRFAWNAGDHVLTCEAVANGSLEPAQRLSDEQETSLRNMGWHPPGRGDAARSENFVRVFYAPKDPTVAAAMGISALRTSYGAAPRRVSWRAS